MKRVDRSQPMMFTTAGSILRQLLGGVFQKIMYYSCSRWTVCNCIKTRNRIAGSIFGSIGGPCYNWSRTPLL